MARVLARNASLGIDSSAGACVALSARASTIALSWTAEAPETTSFGEVNRSRLQDGLQDYELTADMFFDAAAGNVDVTLAAIMGASTRFIFGPNGSSSGCNMYSGCVILTNYSINFGVADAATVSLTLTPRSGSLTRGTFA